MYVLTSQTQTSFGTYVKLFLYLKVTKRDNLKEEDTKSIIRLRKAEEI